MQPPHTKVKPQMNLSVKEMGNLKMYFVYLGSKDTYCTSKICRNMYVLFPTKCLLFHNLVLVAQVILMFFFVKYVLKFK